MRLVVGDIHGGYRALEQVLERSGFDLDRDELITLGDVCDGWSQTREVANLLLAARHLVFVRGNHDQWFIDYLTSKIPLRAWTTQGGAATLKSYSEGVPATHEWLFRHASKPYWEAGSTLFVHGGFNPQYHPRSQDPQVLLWDRTLVSTAYHDAAVGRPRTFKTNAGSTWDKIFVGHTPVSIFDQTLTTPQTWGNLVAMDTGGGWSGKLSGMDVDTGEVWQSDTVSTLYPDEKGR